MIHLNVICIRTMEALFQKRTMAEPGLTKGSSGTVF